MRSCSGGLAVALLVAGVTAPRSAHGDAREDFALHCAPCHGESGDGKGPAAHLLDVPPRDFTSGAYKFRSTESGALPRDEDLLRVIDDGLPGTAMPGWRGVLPAARRKALVDVVKSFSPKFARRAAPEPLEFPEEPAPDAGAYWRGRDVFVKLKCAECHGDGGRGDGPSARTLKDDAGRFLPTPDLTLTGKLRTRSEKDLLRVLYTGLNGTPMPSYAAVLQPGEAWDLVRYLYALRSPPCWWRTFLFDPPLVWRSPEE